MKWQLFFILVALVSTAGSAFGEAAQTREETLILKNGERHAGENLGFDQGNLQWKLPDGTVMSVPIDQVDRVEYVERPAGGGEENPKPEVVPPAFPEIEDSSEPEPDSCFGHVRASVDAACQRALCYAEDWTQRIELGARFLDGNTNEDFLNVATKFEQKRDHRETEIELGGQYGKTGDDVTANRWFGNTTVDFDRDSNWIFFVATKNEHDEPENLDYRGTFSTGFGYRFINEEERKLVVRLGPGVTHERFDDPSNSRTTPDAFGETALKWPLFERVEFEHKTSVNPSVEDVSVVRLNSNNDFLYKLDEDGNWRLKLGFRYEYNSDPNDGREKNDYTTTLLLVYTRK